MNTQTEKLLQKGLDYIDSLSIDEFEQALRHLGLNPVRKFSPKDTRISVETYTYLPSHSVPTELTTSFSTYEDTYLA
jgi:hypothetical protein